jgi:tRNA(adenine34) deaminase
MAPPPEGTDLDVRMMRRALDQARLAAGKGEVPVGAVIYRGDEVLAEAHNERELAQDPTGHAEMIALRAAAKRLGSWRLDGCSLVVTLEPCPMCAGAMVNARLPRLVYGAADPKMGCVDTLYRLCSEPRFNHRLVVARGVLAEECGAVLKAFFQARRGTVKPPKPASS